MLQMNWYKIVCVLLYLTNCVLGIIVPDCIVHVALHVVIVLILRILVPCLNWNHLGLIGKKVSTKHSTHLHYIVSPLSILRIVSPIVQVDVLLLLLLAGEAALDSAVAFMADHVNESDNRQDDHKANHGDEYVEPDREPTCIYVAANLDIQLV